MGRDCCRGATISRAAFAALAQRCTEPLDNDKRDHNLSLIQLGARMFSARERAIMKPSASEPKVDRQIVVGTQQQQQQQSNHWSLVHRVTSMDW